MFLKSRFLFSVAYLKLKLSVILLNGFYSIFKEKSNGRMFSGTDIEFRWDTERNKNSEK